LPSCAKRFQRNAAGRMRCTNPRIYRGHLYGAKAAQNAA
jgi:hypothetical protein